MAETALPVCSVIIPTLASQERGDSLMRAISSISFHNKIPLEVLVVVNGQRWSPDVIGRIIAMPMVRVVQIKLGSLPNAISIGRQYVSAPYFCFLDDDDEYLPGSVDLRVKVMEDSPSADVLVTNGFRNIEGVDKAIFNGQPDLRPDPLLALFKQNWLPSCGGIFRTRTIENALFDQVADGLEWTWLAYSIVCARKSVIAISDYTFRINDTPLSASKSDAYLFKQVECFKRMLTKSTRADITLLLRRKLSQVHHDISNHHRKRGNMMLAWKNHLASLGALYGLRFISYSRYLLKK